MALLRHAKHTRDPTRDHAWDLGIVLEGLSAAPFEPLESVSEKFLMLKTVFLLAISPSKKFVMRRAGPLRSRLCRIIV